ncbi:MAG: methyltransferase domain-containing protein, partial [Ilumatobacteraceae bacterium]
MSPYVQQIQAAIESGAGRAGPVPESAPAAVVGSDFVPSEYFHAVLHELRTVELERLPKGARRALSVGASGRWYFDWFERSVGQLDVHIGVEAFEAEPADLPSYVHWIPTSADRFDGVADEDVDLVFAGQTSEHLWARELADFLVQSHRVLRPDGRLVVDSPNRLVTEHLRWSHGGHTVELAAGEIRELLRLAGFRPESLRGLWRCRFGET